MSFVQLRYQDLVLRVSPLTLTRQLEPSLKNGVYPGSGIWNLSDASNLRSRDTIIRSIGVVSNGLPTTAVAAG